MRNRIKKALNSSIVAGVEFVQLDQTSYYNLVVLQLEKEEIKILDQQLHINSLVDLKEKLEANTPVYLAVNIRGIIHKKLNQATENNQQVLQSFFPNASVDDFYLQKENLPVGVLVSVARKKTIDQLVLDFEQQDLWLLAIRLGSFDVKYLINFLENRDRLQTETQTLHFNTNNQLTDFSKSELKENLRTKIGDDLLDNRLLTAFAAAFKALVVSTEDGLAIPAVKKNKAELFHKNLFQKAGWALLGGAVVLLLLNLFFYYNYKEKNEQLGTQMIYTNAQLNELDSLKNRVERQKTFLQQTQLNQNSKSSFIADRIAASLLKGLQLSELEIFPMQGKRDDYKENDLIQYNKEEVLVKGYCESSLIYNDWIKKLQAEDWVKEIQHLEYKDISNKLGEFEMKIIIAF